MKPATFFFLLLCLSCSTLVNGQGPKPISLDNVYADQSHCLTSADMRTDGDKAISCFCRDVIVDARYIYSTYVLPGKDSNLNGSLLQLEEDISAKCGRGPAYAVHVAQDQNWKWDGPEVVRTYPPDEVVKRIKPERGGRWVPFTVQLIYRDSRGQAIRTENYSSKEFAPERPHLRK